MLIKTPEFESTFLDDINFITINRKVPLQIKGSYKIKQYQEPITDIDLQALVYYNDILPRIIYNIINKNNTNTNSPFTFIQLGVGRYKGFELPWTIDNNGGCNYNPQKVKEWFSKFSSKNLVPSSVIDYIKDKLFGESITIRNLINIENALLPYSEIKWSPEDINRGFIDKNGERYFLLDAFQTETPVLEYIYRYKDSIIPIDVGLVDKRHKTEQIDAMYKHYTQNWYKILKNYRWKVKPEFQSELLKKTGEVNNLIAINYQIELLSRLEKIPQISSDIKTSLKNSIIKDLKQIGFFFDENNLSDTERKIEDQINNKLEKYVQEFIPMLDNKYKSTIIKQIERGEEAQNPVKQQILNSRHDVGIRCPFFPTDIEEYDILSELAVRLNLPIDFVVNCFSKTATETKTNIKDLVQSLGQNNYSISILDNTVVLREGTQELETYSLDNLNILRIFILIG